MHEERKSDAQRVIICAGMLGSASTWLFNVVRSIEKIACQRTASSEYLDDLTPDVLVRLIHTSGAVVLKSHIPRPSLLAAVHFGRLPVLLTVRDPRDAAASLMMRFGATFASAVEQVEACAAALLRLASISTPLTLKYEDGFFENWRTVCAVASFIGYSLSPQSAQSICAGLSRDNTLEFIDAKIKEGTLDSADPAQSCDSETQWHPRHIGDGRVGKFMDVLSTAQVSQLSEATRSFNTRFYPHD
jgi:hypothetical protein